MLFTFRVALPDRPGALAQLTSLIASYQIDVRAIDVLGGKLSEAVDQFLLEGDVASIDGLTDELRSAGTFTVLGVRRAGITKEHVPELTVVQAVAKNPERALAILTDAAPRLLDSDWALGFESGFAALPGADAVGAGRAVGWPRADAVEPSHRSGAVHGRRSCPDHDGDGPDTGVRGRAGRPR